MLDTARLALAALAVMTCACKRVSEHRVHRAPARVLQRSLADVAADVTPSVVNVFSARDVAVNLGSGVIVSSDGVIVTNYHVVEAADAIAVVLHDGREMEATVVGGDPETDVAVIRIDAHRLRAIEFGDSSKIRVGDLVLAVGNPFGIGQTVTLGIISATGRANLGINDVEDFIQTDAAINPGNSGGALVDMEGRLVGINTAIMSRSGGYQGIGFAIPSNMVAMAEQQLVRHGKVTRGFFGVIMKDQRLRSGVVVDGVTPGGPAALAGIASGDVIVAFAGVPVTDATHLKNLVALMGPTHVRVEVVRAGKTLEREVSLGEEPTPRGRSAAARPK